MLDYMARVCLLSKKLRDYGPKCYPFASLKIINENSCYTSLSAFGFVSVSDFGYSNRCIVASCFNLHSLMT